MEEKELNTIISWIINRKCKRDDNIHIKRAVKKSNEIMRITKLETDEIIDRLTYEIMNSSGKYLNTIEKPFPYIAKIIYDSALPKILDDFLQDNLQKELEVI